MKIKTPNSRLVLLLIITIYCFMIITLINSNIYFQEENDNIIRSYDILDLKKSKYWNLTGSPIFIDDTNPNFNWNKASSENLWCSGEGTENNPYLIENVLIDGQSSGDCIRIQNSYVYFIIRNCTVFNAGGSNAGISLEYVNNSQLIDNNCLNGSETGIYLKKSCQNLISNNLINATLDDGIFIEGSGNNIITRNMIYDNIGEGICFSDDSSGCENNLFYGNFLKGNGQNGEVNPYNNTFNSKHYGNYWDDYSGVDENNDGIGDTPYIIPGSANAKDYLPLMEEKIPIIESTELEIPFGNFYIIFILITIASLTIVMKSKRLKIEF